MTALSKAELAAVASHLSQNLPRRVSLEVWTRKQSAVLRSDRDPCTHCDDTLELARQIASLHAGISLTLYDLDRHADRAQEAGIERPPVTVIRAGGRELRFIGLWSGGLLPTFIDAMVYAAAGTTPLEDAVREALGELTVEIELEALVAPYDAYSAHLMRLVFALAVESPRIRAQAIDIAEFPMLAATRGVTDIPVLIANGRRYVGTWEPAELVEQLRRVAAGDDAPVIRGRVPATRFLTEEETQQAAQAQAGSPPPVSGGLVLPGSS